jgi:hypothetical protein
MSNVQIDNLTEALQRHLGLQQAQTFTLEDTVGDAIARVSQRRGDVSALYALWDDTKFREHIDGYVAEEHAPALEALRDVLHASLVVQQFRDRRPRSFLPLAPRFVTSKDVNSIFRDLGRSVVEGLWQRTKSDDLARRVLARVETWSMRHPLALLLGPMCRERNDEGRGAEGPRLADAITADPQLERWVKTTVREDWEAWLRAVDALSVDEEIESMAALIGLHLHTALLWRLRDEQHPDLPPCYFVCVPGRDVDSSCVRAGYNSYAFWGDRANHALALVAGDAVDRAAAEDPNLKATFGRTTWGEAAPWLLVRGVKGKSQRSTRAFKETLEESLKRGAQGGKQPADGEIRTAVVAAMIASFSGSSGVIGKVKDMLRTTGYAVGLVGPAAAYTRKRYQIDDKALSLLARLHAHRKPDEVRSGVEERHAVDAFLDDLFARYGMIVTRERDCVRETLAGYEGSPALRAVLRHLPGDEPMRRNRALFERRLDELRLVRRYSDASAVLHVV